MMYWILSSNNLSSDQHLSHKLNELSGLFLLPSGYFPKLRFHHKWQFWFKYSALTITRIMQVTV